MKNNEQTVQSNFPLRWFKKQLWFVFLLGIFVLAILLPLFQKGTFIDGMLYKTVAYNYSIGEASFWNMKFTNTCMTFFCEQPPLYFFLLGNFYKVLGNHYLVDRFYTLLLFVLLIIAMRMILKRELPNHNNGFLLSIFLLIAIPVFCWSYVNQVIEPLVNLLTAIAILLFQNYRDSKKCIYVLLFALTVYLLFLSKGFQSCFVIVLPFFYFLISKARAKIASFGFFVLLIALAVIYCSISVYTPGLNWFDCYYKTRLVLTMENTGYTTDYHLEIIIRFFTELLVCLVLILAFFTFISFKRNYPIHFVLKNFISNKLAFSLLLTALAGSFPYAISLVQRGFYLVPSFICFVLAIVFGFKRYWLFFYRFLCQLSSNKIVRVLVFCFALATSFYAINDFNDYKRDRLLVQDVDLIMPFIHEGDTIHVQGDLWNYFSLHSYLYMNKKISLSGDIKNAKFSLVDKKVTLKEIDSSYSNLRLITSEINLFRIKKKK